MSTVKPSTCTFFVQKVSSSLQTKTSWPGAPKSSTFLNRPKTLYPLSVFVRVWERQRAVLTAVMCLCNSHQHTFGSFAYLEFNSRQHPESKTLNFSDDRKWEKASFLINPSWRVSRFLPSLIACSFLTLYKLFLWSCSYAAFSCSKYHIFLFL